MARYQFTSPAAAFSDALEQTLFQRAMQQRQAMLDKLTQDRTAAEIDNSAQIRQLQRDQFGYQQTRDQQLDQFRDEQARTAAAERAALADANRTFQAEQMEANRTAAAERAAADRDLREMIARMSASNSGETRELANRLREVQIATAEDKLDATRTDRAKAEQANQTARQDVAALAASILHDPRLDSRVGSLQGRLPAFTGDQRDFDNQVKRLQSLLSLESRSKLKGSGAISDFEAQTLGAAASALDQATDERTFRRELERIIQTTGGTAAAKPTAQELIQKYGGR